MFFGKKSGIFSGPLVLYDNFCNYDQLLFDLNEPAGGLAQTALPEGPSGASCGKLCELKFFSYLCSPFCGDISPTRWTVTIIILLTNIYAYNSTTCP